jgi:hypothetical protein
MASPQHIFAPNNKRIIRSEPNEYDKATIVSVYPRALHEIKPTIFPSVFKIPAGTITKPTIVIVGPSSWFRDMGEDMPAIEIPNNAVQVANSIVTDYCNGMLEVDKNAGPGIFFIPGEWVLDEIQKKYKDAFLSSITKQTKWYRRLVDLADKDWAQSNGNPKFINELQKLAAAELGVKDKDWMRSTVAAEMIKCVACGNLRNPSFPVCGHCNRVIDAELFKKLGVKESASNAIA